MGYAVGAGWFVGMGGRRRYRERLPCPRWAMVAHARRWAKAGCSSRFARCCWDPSGCSHPEPMSGPGAEAAEAAACTPPTPAHLSMTSSHIGKFDELLQDWNGEVLTWPAIAPQNSLCGVQAQIIAPCYFRNIIYLDNVVTDASQKPFALTGEIKIIKTSLCKS